MDVGDVRIGIAVSDPDGILATPVETVAAGPGAIPRIAELVAELDVLECVVGLPMGLSGREGPAATKVRAFCAKLLPAISPVPIRLFDERMTTTSAHSLLRQGGRSSRTTRGIIDQAAATVILQTALDSERTRGSAPGEST
ncbi:Holliday junction resolvase RuvX [Aeromicrobium yanjiei]|uniref:Holliday junction resolvase RuvX n=1 Tax=Aeromicrobium yanjiei TaxID=2662028 RepID=UPI00312C9A2B